MPQKFFKVVRVEDGKLLSCAVCLAKDIRIEYKENEWMKPKLEGSKLFCFNDLELVEQFVREEMYTHLVHVYECEVKNPAPTEMLSYVKDARHFWECVNCNDYIDNFMLRDIPEGSFSVDEIKLTNKIKEIKGPFFYD